MNPAMPSDLRAVLETLDPHARDTLRRVLVRDQADRDAIASELLRYRDGRGDDWADIIDFLTMHPDARRRIVRRGAPEALSRAEHGHHRPHYSRGRRGTAGRACDRPPSEDCARRDCGAVGMAAHKAEVVRSRDVAGRCRNLGFPRSSSPFRTTEPERPHVHSQPPYGREELLASDRYIVLVLVLCGLSVLGTDRSLHRRRIPPCLTFALAKVPVVGGVRVPAGWA